MKNFIFQTLLLLSFSTFASDLEGLNSLANPLLDSSGKSLSHTTTVTHYSFNKVIKLKGIGRTTKELRLSAVAQSIHALCPYFDGGVSIVLNSKNLKGSMRAVADLLDSSDLSQNDEEYKVIVEAITSINKEPNVELFSGSADGNNTAGTVLGFYDISNNEIAAFASTNCGKDD